MCKFMLRQVLHSRKLRGYELIYFWTSYIYFLAVCHLKKVAVQFIDTHSPPKSAAKDLFTTILNGHASFLKTGPPGPLVVHIGPRDTHPLGTRSKSVDKVPNQVSRGFRVLRLVSFRQFPHFYPGVYFKKELNQSESDSQTVTRYKDRVTSPSPHVHMPQ